MGRATAEPGLARGPSLLGLRLAARGVGPRPHMIGIYDSGFGGLTVLRAVRQMLPSEQFVYLGDSGRAPYGGRDMDTILDYAEQCVERLFDEGCRVIVVACHTVSCTGLRHLQRKYVPSRDCPRRILGVTIPAAQAGVQCSRGHIGVIGTSRTIASRTFELEIAKLSNCRVTGVAAPLLAPLVEEGWDTEPIAELAVAKYVAQLPDIDTLILACTHYPLLRTVFEAVVPPRVTVLDPSQAIAERLVDWLRRHPGFAESSAGGVRYLCTGEPEVFRRHGRRFLGEELLEVGHIGEERGRLLRREQPSVPLGQVVRG